MRHGARQFHNLEDMTLEKYSSGRRGAPAKGIGRVTGARVQIPPSALKILKKVVDKGEKR